MGALSNRRNTVAENINDLVKSLGTSSAKLKDLKPTTITADGVAVVALTGYAVVIRTIAQDVHNDTVTIGGTKLTGENTVADLMKAVHAHGKKA
jgi:hypothetical protein